MELKIKLEGMESVGETSDLLRWIKRERIQGASKITQLEKAPNEGEQGPTLLSIIGIVLGAKATVELVRSIHRWIETRKRSITITVEEGDKTIIIDCQNPPEINTFIDAIKVLTDER